MPRRDQELNPRHMNHFLPTVEVGLPSKIQVDLVQGNDLRHYEIFFSLASVAFSTAVGFWTGYITLEAKNSPLFWTACSFTGLTFFAGALAFYYRGKVYGGRIKRVATLDQFS